MFQRAITLLEKCITLTCRSRWDKQPLVTPTRTPTRRQLLRTAVTWNMASMNQGSSTQLYYQTHLFNYSFFK